jgi:hypothetical protein
MSLYYRIWVDSIIRIRSIKKNKTDWQFKSMVGMTTAMTFNFILIISLFQREILKFRFYEINISSLSVTQNSIITIILLYIIPCIFLNYLLIFRGKRYEKLIERYPYYNGKLYLSYFLISLLLPIILMWVGIFLYQ